MDSPSPPTPPDPVATAAAQSRYNVDAARETAAINRPNQYTPYGSLTWTQSGGTPGTLDNDAYTQAVNSWRESGSQGTMPSADQFRSGGTSGQWSSHVDLDPRVQRLLDTQLQLSGGLQGAQNSALDAVTRSQSVPYDYSSAPAMPQADDAARQRVESALYDRARSRLDPLWEQRDSTNRSTLMNRGIVENSDAFRRNIDDFGRSRNDDYQQATWNSIINGGQEQSRLFNMGMAARQQGVNEINAQHQLPIAMLNALRTGAQPTMPQFGSGNSGATVAPPNYQQGVQNNYTGQIGAYNAEVGSNNSMLGAAGQIGAAALPFILSDRRLKRNIRRIGSLPSGQAWYAFEYFWGEPSEGVMADECPAYAVIRLTSGFDAVDYSKLGV